MGGENNWICIFEADLGCMMTIYVKSTTHRGSCFLFRVPIARSPLGSVTLGGKQRTVLFSYTLAPLRYLLLLRLLLRTNLVFNINIKVRPSGRTFCIVTY